MRIEIIVISRAFPLKMLYDAYFFCYDLIQPLFVEKNNYKVKNFKFKKI